MPEDKPNISGLEEKAPGEAKKTPLAYEGVFGMWKNDPDIGDGVEYQRRIRAEWV